MVHIYMPANKEPLYAMLAFACYSFLFEIVISSRGNIFLTFTSLERIIDIFIVLALVVYCPIFLQHPVNFYNSRLLPWINILSWFKFITYMKNFSKTRVFVQVFAQIMISLVPFLIFVTIQIFTFTTTFI
jgi:hypothetical protein